MAVVCPHSLPLPLFLCSPGVSEVKRLLQRLAGVSLFLLLLLLDLLKISSSLYESAIGLGIDIVLIEWTHKVRRRVLGDDLNSIRNKEDK